jgi:hypothetical protein
LIRIRDAERGAGWDFGSWKNEAFVVVVRFEFEGGELAFEIGFSGFLVDEKNLCLARATKISRCSFGASWGL